MKRVVLFYLTFVFYIQKSLIDVQGLVLGLIQFIAGDVFAPLGLVCLKPVSFNQESRTKDKQILFALGIKCINFWCLPGAVNDQVIFLLLQSHEPQYFFSFSSISNPLDFDCLLFRPIFLKNKTKTKKNLLLYQQMTKIIIQSTRSSQVLDSINSNWMAQRLF